MKTMLASSLLRGKSVAVCRAVLLLVAVGLWVGAPLASGEPLTPNDFPGLKERLAVDIRGMDLIEALKFLALKGNLNIIVSQEVKGSVTLLMDDVSVGDALTTVFSVNRLAYEVNGNIIQVMTEAEYQAMHGTSFYDRRETRMFTLKYAMPSDLARMLESLKSERGDIIFNDTTGTLIVKDLAARITDMETIIKSAEIPTIERLRPTVTKTFKLQYASVEKILPKISDMVTENIGKIREDIRTNTLIVTDLPHRMTEVEAVVLAFDQRRPEVYIEARVVEVTLSDDFRFGIDWKELSKWRLPVEVIEKGLDLRHASLSLMTLEAMSQDLVFDALKEFGKTELISEPRLTVEDGHEATLSVVTSEAYEAGSSEVDSGGVTTSYTNFEFVDVGVSLSVLPKINDDGYVNILIKPEVSSIVDWYGGTSGSAAARSAGSVPVIKRSTAETVVTVKDGVSIMIGGLISETEVDGKSEFPILSNIYGIGPLFRHKNTSFQRRETIIFLTPHIVTGDRSMPWDTHSISTKEPKGVRE